MKTYYAAMGVQQEYNVPLILKVTDSFGNVFYRNDILNRDAGILSKNLQNEPRCFLRPGDILAIEIEVDPAFDPKEYTVRWEYFSGLDKVVSEKPKIFVGISVEHVAESFILDCHIESKRDWHRLGFQGDDRLLITYNSCLALMQL